MKAFNGRKRFLKFVRSPYMLDLCVVITAILFSVIVWMPTRYLPYHWDGAGFFNNAVEDLLNNNFNPLITTNSDFAHPPLLAGLFALTFAVLERSMYIAHLLMFPFLPILIISSYYFAKKLTSPVGGIVVAFLVASTPVILAEYGIVYIDLPAATFSMIALALFAYRKNLSSMWALTASVLTKFTAVLTFPLYLSYFLLDPKHSIKKRLKHCALLLIPTTFLFIFLIYHFQVTGWFLTIPTREFNQPTTLINFRDSILNIASSMFLSQGRWSLTLLAIGFSIYAAFKHTLKSIFSSLFVVPLIITLFISLIFFSLTQEFALRYGIFLYPLFYTLVILVIHNISVRLWPKNTDLILSIVGFVSIGLFVVSWHPGKTTDVQYEFSPPSDLSYQDVITVFRQAAIFLQIKHPDSKLYGAFPENVYTTQTHQGYVSDELDFSLCDQFDLQPQREQIIFIHPYSPYQIVCRQLLDKVQASPLQRFEQGGSWVELYLVSVASAASDLDPNP
jgi:hypothetical protein